MIRTIRVKNESLTTIFEERTQSGTTTLLRTIIYEKGYDLCGEIRNLYK